MHPVTLSLLRALDALQPSESHALVAAVQEGRGDRWTSLAVVLARWFDESPGDHDEHAVVACEGCERCLPLEWTVSDGEGVRLCPTCAPAIADGAALIAAERRRQVEVEGWTPEHDAEHDRGEMALAAATYATPAPRRRMVQRSTSLDGFVDRGDAFWQQPEMWPWSVKWWKPCPDDRVRELVKAGALIAAEIDRLLRKGKARRPAGASETPPEGVTPPSGPVALAHDRFWSYDEGNGIDWHDTEDEARNAAAEALDYARDESGDGWPDWVEHICWGEVRGHVVQVASKHRDDYEAESDEAMVSRMERHGWDTIDDYALADVAMCASANEAADLQRRLADERAKVTRLMAALRRIPSADCPLCSPDPCPECEEHHDPAACSTCDGSSRLHEPGCLAAPEVDHDDE